jgi:hypothetical protein
VTSAEMQRRKRAREEREEAKARALREARCGPPSTTSRFLLERGAVLFTRQSTGQCLEVVENRFLSAATILRLKMTVASRWAGSLASR